MPVLSWILAAALFDDPWPPVETQFGMFGYRSAPIKNELVTAKNPLDPSKEIKAQVFTILTIDGDPKGEGYEANGREVAKTCYHNVSAQSEETTLYTSSEISDIESIELNTSLALMGLNLEPQKLVPRLDEHLRKWPEFVLSIFFKDRIIKTTWNPYADDNPRALVEHDLGFRLMLLPLDVRLRRVFQFEGKTYEFDNTVIPNSSKLKIRVPLEEPIETRVIVPKDAALPASGWGALPWNPQRLPGLQFPGGSTFLLPWPGGDVGTIDVKLEDIKNDDPSWQLILDGYKKSQAGNFLFVGEGMNRIIFNPGGAGANLGPGVPDTMIFPGGTLFVPTDPKHQIVMGGQSYGAPGNPAKELFATRSPQRAPNQGYTLCAQMHKREPVSTVGYFPVAPPNSVYPNLARMTDQAIFKGPAEQARLWIYTNHAGYQEINAKLLPGVSARQYVNCLYEVWKVSGLSPDDLKPIKLTDPVLLGASGLEEEPARWFYSLVVAHHARETEAELQKPSSDLRALLDSDKPDDVKSCATMLGYMLEFGDPAIRRAAMTLLLAYPSTKDAQIKEAVKIPIGCLQTGPADSLELFTKVKERFGS